MRSRPRARRRVLIVACALAIAITALSGNDIARADACGDKFEELRAQHETTVEGGLYIPPVMVEICGRTLRLGGFADIQLMATEEGISMREGIARWGGQTDFAKTAQALQDKYPNEIAGIKYEHYGQSWIAFKSAVPHGAADAVESEPVRFIPNRGFSLQELHNTRDEVVEVARADPDVTYAWGMDDQEDGSIDVKVVPRDRGAGVPSALRTRIDDLKSRHTSLKFNLAARSERPRDVVASHLKGGGFHGAEHCTAGFGVHRSGQPSATGIASAQHCSWDAYEHESINMLRYEDYDHTDAIVPTYFRDRASGASGDISWYGNALHDSGRYYFRNTSPIELHDVIETRFPQVGMRLCKFGVASEPPRSCHDIWKTDQCYHPSPWPEYCGMTFTVGNGVVFGDSGGPWFNDHIGYGITSGVAWRDGAPRSIFTPVRNNYYYAFGVAVNKR